MAKPLEHITILDLSRVLACPFASMILAELGATVIKVEQPGSGDETRSFEPRVETPRVKKLPLPVAAGDPYLGHARRQSLGKLRVDCLRSSMCCERFSVPTHGSSNELRIVAAAEQPSAIYTSRHDINAFETAKPV